MPRRKNVPDVLIQLEKLPPKVGLVEVDVEARNRSRHRPLEGKSSQAVVDAIDEPATNPPSPKIGRLKRKYVVALSEDGLVSH